MGSDYKEPVGVKFRNVTGDGKSLKQNSSVSSMPRPAFDSVSLPRFDNPQDVSDKLQTMSGFPSVPSGIASQTI